MRYNTLFHQIAAGASLGTVSQRDLPESLWDTINEGWVRDERGAWLLKRFLRTYSGSAHTDLTGYEASVNGRAIPDIDLTSQGEERARDLARRGYAFARMALYRLYELDEAQRATAYISIAPVEVDDEQVYTGSVTIVTHHDGEPPYLPDVDDVTANAVLAVESSECTQPLPMG